jgi:hypothetical protein
MALRVRGSTPPDVRVGYLLRVPDLYLLHRGHTDSGQKVNEDRRPLPAATRIPPMLRPEEYSMIGTPRFQHGGLIRVKNKTTDDTWFLRFYEDVQGQRVYRKQRIGAAREFPRKADAEKAVLALRAKINSDVRSPETVNELIAHYTKHELTADRKAFSTVEAHRGCIDRYLIPKWGACKLPEVKRVLVEQ